MAAKVSKRRRIEVYERDGWQCQYCGVPIGTDTATIDHIDPVSEGGRSAAHNLRAACVPCNSSKGARGVEAYRDSVAIKRSIYRGVISASQYRRLVELGAVLDDLPVVTFHYEVAQS